MSERTLLGGVLGLIFSVLCLFSFGLLGWVVGLLSCGVVSFLFVEPLRSQALCSDDEDLQEGIMINRKSRPPENPMLFKRRPKSVISAAGNSQTKCYAL
ncbi:uncharacterized protein J3D65DRAFT_626164 [Phyllosticta citribraziliensis]|uniref:Uncharacterized protein n=1 Tax=Phyllosticta citribraziliensis TaxID=989973 RepID=A0ABR1LP27_9PEZI